MSQAGMEVPESIRKFNILCKDGARGSAESPKWRGVAEQRKESAKSPYH